MHGQADDIAVIQLILQGQQAAYATIVDKYQQYVFTLVLRYISNREVAEELAQDVFIKAYKYLADFKGNSKFSTWLYTIVNSTCLSYLRKKKDETVLLEEERMILLDTRAEEQPSRTDLQLKKQHIENALGKLPAEDAQIITLFYLAEQSVEEIGIIMGITATNVKVRLFRARQKLKEHLKSIEKQLLEY